MTADPSPAMRCRGIRGATFATDDTPEAILSATRELLSAFPARAARELGWTDVPLLGATEIDHPTAPRRCVRVLLHWNTTRRQDEIVHVYLRGADAMRAQDPPSHLAGTVPLPG